MGPPQRQQARPPPGGPFVWVVAALLLLAVLAGGGCLVAYLTLPPSAAPQWLAAAGLALVALPWGFWIATCAYRCCCSANAASEAGAGGNAVERQPSRPAAVAPMMPMPSSKCLKIPGSGGARNADASSSTGSPTTSSATRRVRFGEATVLGEEPPAAAADKDDASSVHSNESEAPLAQSMQSS